MSLPLRYRIFGIRHRTGHINWHLVRQLGLLALFIGLLFGAAGNLIATLNLLDRVTYLQDKLELREQQITRCLNGQSVGYVDLKDRLVFSICNPATEISIGL